MAAEADKAQAFTARFLRNPARGELTPLQQEEQIIQFLNSNAGRSAPVLSHSSFFSGKSWAEVQSLLLQQLKQIVNQRINFSSMQLFRRQKPPTKQIREQLMHVLRQIIKRPDGRRALTGAYTALHYDLRARYIDGLYGVAAENAW